MLKLLRAQFRLHSIDKPAAVAVKALRYAAPADAALCGLDCGPRRPNNLLIRAKAKRKIGLLGTEPHQRKRALTQNRGHFPDSCK